MKQFALILVVSLMSAVVLADQPACVVDADEARGERIVKEWIAGNHGTTLVHGKVRRVVYDHVFHIQKISAGEFGYSNSVFGFLKLEPSRAKITCRINKKNGKPYELELDEPEHWRWYPQKIQAISEPDKQVDEVFRPVVTHGHAVTKPVYSHFQSNELPTNGKRIIEIYSPVVRTAGVGGWLMDAFATIDGVIPFLPGNSDTRTIHEWALKLTQETDTHVHIRASPTTIRNIKHCDLRFQKDPWRLVGEQLTDPTGNTQAAMFFAGVETNSTAWLEPDLAAYKTNSHFSHGTVVSTPVSKRRQTPVQAIFDLYWPEAK